ncbi:MAG: hypothetical protein K2K17_03545, partial [Lachnospiraceae bacterium]|nr:hypothetical protein [Lachnospiraceae bacterium]
TVESLIDGLYENEIESQTADVEMEIELSISAMGFSFDVSADGDFEVQYSVGKKDAVTTYINGEFAAKIPVGGIDEKLGIEAYSIVDDETVTSYASVEGGEWYMTELELDDSAGMDQETTDKIAEAMKDVLKENGELAEDTEKVEGEECYVITATIEGSDWSDVLEPMQDMIDEVMEEADMDVDMLSWFEYISADITYYISKDTGYLVKAEMDMSDTDLLGMFEQMVKDLGGEEDLADVFEGLESVSFSKFYISAVYSDVNDTKVEVPDDVIDDAVDINDAVSIDDLMGSIDDDPIVTDPIEDDPIEDDPIEDDLDDDWYKDGSFTFNKDYESDEFLCEVTIPNGWTVDTDFSDPEYGLVCLDKNDGNGYIWVQNYLTGSMYYGLLNGGELSVNDYPAAEDWENYNMEITVIGTACGGSDVMLVEESYDSDGWTYEETYICIEYADGGYREFLCVDCNSIWNLDEWTEDDFLDLAVSLFGR